MAERRMIHRKAAVSSDLTELRRRHGGDAVAFFHQLIPFYDRWGCVPDDAQKLRAMACPLWEDVTSRDVRRWIEWMVKRAMLVRVTGSNGERGLRNPSFEDHQRGTKFEREAPSAFEPEAITRQWARTRPKGGDMQGGPDQVRTRSRLGPRKGKEGKGSNTSPSFPPSPFPDESAAAPPEPEPAAQAAPPGVSENGRREREPERASIERIAASMSPPIREAMLRAARRSHGDG